MSLEFSPGVGCIVGDEHLSIFPVLWGFFHKIIVGRVYRLVRESTKPTLSRGCFRTRGWKRFPVKKICKHSF